MKLNVLIIDDVQVNVALVTHLIAKVEDCVALGFTVPEQALAWCETQLPDLLIVDYMMPGLNGIELIRRFRALHGREDIPVLMVTANDQIEVCHQALQIGANDFLTKPINKTEFMARVNNMLALRRSQRRLEQSNLILNDEKELLEDIVTRMRSSSPFDTRGVRYIQSSLERTAGDIVLSAYRPDGIQHVVVGDFAGHGLPAAFGGPLASYIFYHLTQQGCDLGVILAELNRTLSRQLPTQIYMAASALELSADRKQAQLWNFGLPPTLCLSNAQGLSRVISQGLPLGILESDEGVEPHVSLQVEADMRFYQYTDGITEAASPEQDLYSQERLDELVRRIYRDKLPLDVVWCELAAFCVGQGLSDDAVMVETSV